MFVPDLVATYNLQLFSERNRPKKIERYVSSEKWSSKDRATALCLEYIVEEYTEYEEVPYGSSTDIVSYEDVSGILTCYPLENIK